VLTVAAAAFPEAKNSRKVCAIAAIAAAAVAATALVLFTAAAAMLAAAVSQAESNLNCQRF
jgi:hypothetical protein